MCALRFSMAPIVALVIGSFLSGCQTITGAPDRLYSIAEEKLLARDDVLPGLEVGYRSSGAETDRRFFRNEYIARRMYIIDVAYTEYEAALTHERQQFGFVSAVVAQSLSTAGAIVTGVNTVHVLSGLTGGVNASRGFFDSELLLTKTVQIAQGHMRAQRDRIARNILFQRAKSTLEYPLSAALHDLEDYYRAGTITAGLIEAVGAAGEDAQAASASKAAAQGVPEPEIIIRNPTAPLSRPLRTPVVISPTRLTEFERGLTAKEIREFQGAVCVTTDGELGPLGSTTRLAIQRELQASDQLLTERKGILLRRKLRNGVTCS
jgi:hypothetical protein